MKIKLALIAASLLAAQQAATAAEWPDNAVYVGIGAGQSKLKGDVADFVNNVPGTSFDDKDTTGKVFIGKQFNRNFAVEATYGYLGKFTADNGFYGATAQGRSVGLDAVLTVPVTQRFGILGRAGVARTRVDGSIAGFEDRGYSTDPKYGLGLQYKFSDKVAIRGEFERQRVKFDEAKSYVNTTSVSLVYKFGSKPAPVRTAPVVYNTPAPAPVAAPAPAVAQPAPAPAEAPVVTTKKVRE